MWIRGNWFCWKEANTLEFPKFRLRMFCSDFRVSVLTKMLTIWTIHKLLEIIIFSTFTYCYLSCVIFCVQFIEH